MYLKSTDRFERDDLFPGGKLSFIHGATMTIAQWEFDEGCRVPEHRHVHEQITVCLAGELELTVDGFAHLLMPGDSFAIPSDAVHSAVARTRAAGFDVFHPVREDYQR